MVAFAQRRLVARGELILAGVLLALGAVAWAITADRMGGMDAGPGTDPGTVGFFVVVWVVMMAAMMFPSVLPMVVVYDRVSRRHGRTPFFVAGYLLTWTGAGLLAYGLFVGGRAVAGGAPALGRGGRHGAPGGVGGGARLPLPPPEGRR